MIRRVSAAVASWPPSQRLLRAAVLLGPVVALLCVGMGAPAPPVWSVLAVAVLATTWAGAPGSAAGSAVMVVVVVSWARAPGDALHPGVLLASGALIAAHVAALLVSAAPPETPVDRRVTRLWLWRGALVWAVAPVLWVLARALREEGGSAMSWSAGLVAVLVAVLAAAAAFPGAPRPR